jgi:amino acid adenylation domain-containing protein
MIQVKGKTDGLTLDQKRALAARLLRGKNGVPAGAPGLVHRWIEAQAARNPEATALAGTGEALTYRDLNLRANCLARRLRALGVGPEVLVGICARRSPALVVGLLAVLKAGGAYLPLDLAYPAERLDFMLNDAGAAVLLTQSDLLGRLPASSASIVCLDREEESLEAEAEDDLPGGAGLDNLAYVIFTSGSTGKPKGAMIHHRGLANYLGWCVRDYAVSQGQGAPVHSSISFDLTITALLAPLVAGRRVDLLDDGLGIEQLAEALRDPRDYSLVKITPAHLRALADQLGADRLAGRTRAFIIGGEQLTSEHVALWRQGAPETVLVNEYGPTETVVGCCVYRVPRDASISGAIPIGRPIANTRLYVLDRRLRLVPVGVAGELYIGGAGVARGYLRRPGLTAERFIPDPLGEEPGGRMYHTGDLARWRPDGNLEYLGRIDQQVKVRGFRVELGEVEAALVRNPKVLDAVVEARPDSTGEMCLSAYFVPRDGADPPATAELRRRLREHLPEYMIPSIFVRLDAFPLTPNGKVDRSALPDPAQSRLSSTAGFMPPRGPIELAVAEIWTDLLGGGPVDIHDSFFESGGHSLLVLQLLSRIRHTFGVEVNLKDFLDEATVARLARLVEKAMAEGAAFQAPPLCRARRDAPLPASFAQQRLWFLDQLEPGRSTYHIPAAVRLVGRLDEDALKRAVNEVVRRHEALRTSLVSDGGVPRQLIAETLELSMAVEDLSSLAEDQREALAFRRIREEAERPFDLARGPLVRAGLLRLGEEDHVVMVTMHHAVSDGWSNGILIREVSTLYEAFRLGEPSPLPELLIQYADYAVWQRNWFQGPALEMQLAHWRERLAGVAELELTTDRPRPAIASQRGGERSMILPKSTLDAVRALGRGEGATLYITVLAAFQVLLHRHSGHVDIAVGSPIAGRVHPDLEGLIGLFANTLVLRSDLSGNPSFRELLRRVRRTAMDALAHQDVPFDELVALLHPQRSPDRTPFFQVMFVLQNDPLPALRTPGLVLTTIELPSWTSKFDLTLFASEGSEGLRLTMEYSSDLFDSATADRLLAHYHVLIEEIIADPDRSIGALRMLTQAERELLLGGWSAASTDELTLTFDDVDDDAIAALDAPAAMEPASHE